MKMDLFINKLYGMLTDVDSIADETLDFVQEYVDDLVYEKDTAISTLDEIIDNLRNALGEKNDTIADLVMENDMYAKLQEQFDEAYNELDYY